MHLSALTVRPVARSRPAARGGFSMIEVLMATMILAVGLIMLFPAFSVGLDQSRRSTESAIAMQLGPNAEAYCRALMDVYTDGNFVPANRDGLIHIYDFRDTPGGTPAGALPGFIWWRQRSNGAAFTTPPADERSDPDKYERINPRIYGDPYSSRYYWSLMYRFPLPGGDRSMVELWIMICKRTETDKDSTTKNPPVGLRGPSFVSVSGSAGDETLAVGDLAALLEPGSGVVTNTGEVLRIASVDDKDTTSTADDEIFLASPVQKDFSQVAIVKFADSATTDNACIAVFYATLGS